MWCRTIARQERLWFGKGDRYRGGGTIEVGSGRKGQGRGSGGVQHRGEEEENARQMGDDIGTGGWCPFIHPRAVTSHKKYSDRGRQK